MMGDGLGCEEEKRGNTYIKTKQLLSPSANTERNKGALARAVCGVGSLWLE